MHLHENTCSNIAIINVHVSSWIILSVELFPLIGGNDFDEAKYIKMTHHYYNIIRNA